MDLSFSRLIAADEVPLPTAEMTLLEAAAFGRQASATDDVETLLTPPSGAFNDAMAACLAERAKP